MKNIGKVAITAQLEGKNWKQELYKFLRNYRNTPHPSTGKTPAALMMGRPVRTKLPSIKDRGDLDAGLDLEIRSRDRRAKEIIASSRLRYGDKVLVKAMKGNKFASQYDPNWYRIVDVKGSMVTAERRGHRITRNLSFFKRYSGNQVYAPE